MKNWKKRSIAIISLGVLGALALAMRPAFCSDEAADTSFPDELTARLAAVPENALDIHYTLDLERPLGYTCYLNEGDANAFDRIEPAKWGIRVYTEGDRLKVSGDTPVLHSSSALDQTDTRYVLGVFPYSLRKMPDNSHHRIYQLVVVCQISITPSFWQGEQRTVLVQSFLLDPESGTMDPEPPALPQNSNRAYREPVRISRLPMEGIPLRISGTAEERALSAMLYALGGIDCKRDAQEAAAILPTMAKKAAPHLPQPDKPWPECWGAAAPLAQEYAKRITPTLVYLQGKECFGVTPLADFINSPDFALFFGESFADKVPDPLDEPLGGFTIERVPMEQLETEEAQPETDNSPQEAQ